MVINGPQILIERHHMKGTLVQPNHEKLLMLHLAITKRMIRL